jgi:TonB family protein
MFGAIMKMYIPLIVLFLSLGQTLTAQATMVDGAYTLVEQMPQYPGGTDSLLAHVMAKVVYPQACADSGIQGKVYLRFIVDEKGNVTNVEAIKGPHPLLKKAAEGAVTGLTGFTPGTEKGKPVKVWYSLPVNFKLVTQADNIANKDDEMGPLAIEKDTVYTFVDTAPKFPAGDEELIAFLQRNINYPQQEKSNGIGGRVIVRFVIDTNGSVTNIKVMSSVSPNLDLEAIRVVSLLPKFIPGIQDGKNVKVYFTLPVVFRSDNQYIAKKTSLFDYYPGGGKETDKFMRKNLNYPEGNKSKKLEAYIKVRCKLDDNLKLKPLLVLNALNDDFDKEAIRLIELMPAFDKSILLTNYIKQDLIITIPFVLNTDGNFFTFYSDVQRSTKYYNIGVKEFTAGNYQDALVQFNYAINVNPQDGASYFNRGATKLKLNDKEGACDDFKRAYLLGELDAMDGIKEACQ